MLITRLQSNSKRSLMKKYSSAIKYAEPSEIAPKTNHLTDSVPVRFLFLFCIRCQQILSHHPFTDNTHFPKTKTVLQFGPFTFYLYHFSRLNNKFNFVHISCKLTLKHSISESFKLFLVSLFLET